MAKSGPKRRRRARRIQRLAAVLTAVVLLLALAGLGYWRLFAKRPGTVQYYPVEYEALIRENAAANHIPPAYIAAVILAESSYQPEAVSYANAQGLMQLLPDTAQWIAPKFGETYEEGCLFEPARNIRYGSWYLGFLMDRYAGDMRCASSAYHAGQGNVDKWLQNPDYSADGRTLSAIPFDNTRTYVDRVLRYYEKYTDIYARLDAAADPAGAAG